MISNKMFYIHYFMYKYMAQVRSEQNCLVRKNLLMLFFWKTWFHISAASDNFWLMVAIFLTALNDKIKAVSVKWLIHDSFINVLHNILN